VIQKEAPESASEANTLDQIRRHVTQDGTLNLSHCNLDLQLTQVWVL
jgi:hypothetical protein